MIIDLMFVMGFLLVVVINVLKVSGCKDICVMVLVVVFEGIKCVLDVYLDVIIFMVLID